MINTALVISAKHLSHSIRIMVFAHDGKGIPDKSGYSLTALMVTWCLLRMAYTALRADDDTSALESSVALILAALTPAFLRHFLRPSAFFVFGHASLPIEVLLLIDLITSAFTGKPLLFTGWLLAVLIIWTIAASFLTMLRYIRQT